jgi:hypothetical protein
MSQWETNPSIWTPSPLQESYGVEYDINYKSGNKAEGENHEL